MQIFSFDATISTHDLLKRGITAGRLPGSQHRHHRIVIAAENATDAALLAAQMASAHGMVTGLFHRI